MQCACGCGEEISCNKWGRKLKYKNYQHFSRKFSGENNHQWKGVNVGYPALHDWLEKRIPKPDKCPRCNLPCNCSECGRTLKLQLANITGAYERGFDNWQWMCRKCHSILDVYKRDAKTGRFLKTVEMNMLEKMKRGLGNRKG